jgi:hypothetical protein
MNLFGNKCLQNTVKPVNDDHPWDPEKLVVFEKVVINQRSPYIISNLFS